MSRTAGSYRSLGQTNTTHFGNHRRGVAGGLRVPLSNLCRNSQSRRETEAQRCLRGCDLGYSVRVVGNLRSMMELEVPSIVGGQGHGSVCKVGYTGLKSWV